MAEKIIIPNEMPLVVLRPRSMLLPTNISVVFLGQHPDLINRAKESDKIPYVFLCMERPRRVNEEARLYPTGVVASIGGVGKDAPMLRLKGEYRARLTKVLATEPNTTYFTASVGNSLADMPDKFFMETGGELVVAPEYDNKVRAFLNLMKDRIITLLEVSRGVTEMNGVLLSIDEVFEELDTTKRSVIDELVWQTVLGLPNINAPEKQELIESLSLLARLRKCTNLLEKNIEIVEMERKFGHGDNQSTKNIADEPRADQNNLITGKDHPELRKRWELFKKVESSMTPDARNRALYDFKTLKSFGAPEKNTHEWPKYEKHLDTNLNYPWGKESKQEKDPAKVKRILDEDHYGLEVPKDNILDNLAPSLINSTTSGEIICFVGPPGVGKTSLGESIARAMNRPFVRISVGGIKDESQIRGHAFTYIGAEPGQIIKKIIDANSIDPVFMVDEIDKMGGMTINGDPQSAMLEVLDPKQNKSFHDHYADFGIDLSKVLFICTANVEHTILEALRDRMFIIRLPGYTEEEKVQIAIRHLIPRLLKEVNLVKQGDKKLETLVNVAWADGTILKIIQDHTSEAGVRNLEQNLKTILKKICRRYNESKEDGLAITDFTVNDRTIVEFLGPAKFFRENASLTNVGETYGLAWTERGGVILKIEVIDYPRPADKKTLAITGLQGDVMKDSDYIATSIIRSRAKEFFGEGVSKQLQNEVTVHIHIPAGAVPKDGPSAGITIFTALYSHFSKRAVMPFLAMTGELSLKGMVLPVGGILEKVVAAERAGIKHLILPEANRRNLHNVPALVKDNLDIKFVNHIDEVIAIAFPEEKSTDSLTDRSVGC